MSHHDDIAAFELKVKNERVKLYDIFPDLQCSELRGEIRKFAENVLHFTDEEISRASDHREVCALYMAYLYHKGNR